MNLTLLLAGLVILLYGSWLTKQKEQDDSGHLGIGLLFSFCIPTFLTIVSLFFLAAGSGIVPQSSIVPFIISGPCWACGLVLCAHWNPLSIPFYLLGYGIGWLLERLWLSLHRTPAPLTTP